MSPLPSAMHGWPAKRKVTSDRDRANRSAYTSIVELFPTSDSFPNVLYPVELFPILESRTISSF